MKKTVEIIRRMSPGNKCLVFEAVDFAKCSVSGFFVDAKRIIGNLFSIDNLDNGKDYVLAVESSAGEVCERPFRCGRFPGTVINYIHPGDKIFFPSGMCPASPSVIELENGRILVSHDVFYHDMAQNISFVYYSDNKGMNWHYMSLLEGCFWGKLFIYSDRLFMLANLHEYGDLVLYESHDKGWTWNRKCTIIEGGNKYTGGPHKGPMPVLEHNGRIWTAVEFGSWHLGGHSCGYITAAGDIAKKENWTVSDFTPYDPSWTGTARGKSSGCIEGNIVIRPDGRMVDFLRYGIEQCEPNIGKAICLSIDQDNPGKAPEYFKTVDFTGNHSKFAIKYDKSTKRFWSIVNRADRISPKRRNELVLVSSADTENWVIEKTLMDYEHSGWYEDRNFVGFQYVDFIFCDDEILFVSRTALNGALNYHDSNCITFHKVRYR